MREADFPFHVEQWSEGFRAPCEKIALARNQLVARGAFLAAKALYPDAFLMLRHGARILVRHAPHSPEKA